MYGQLARSFSEGKAGRPAAGLEAKRSPRKKSFVNRLPGENQKFNFFDEPYNFGALTCPTLLPFYKISLIFNPTTILNNEPTKYYCS